jgi:hypothetical protein
MKSLKFVLAQQQFDVPEAPRPTPDGFVARGCARFQRNERSEAAHLCPLRQRTAK